jgi:hypothetical protein
VGSCWVRAGEESGNFPSDPVVNRYRWVTPAQLSSFRLRPPFLGTAAHSPVCAACTAKMGHLAGIQEVAAAARRPRVEPTFLCSI